ncbi:hypothetical protein TSOC_001291, partial [Tetrabaena socialis]
ASDLDLSAFDDEDGSVSSALSCRGPGGADLTVEDEYERQLDALFEKRASTREKALASVIVMLRVEFRYEEAVQHNETLVARCLLGLKRGGPIESSRSSQLLGLHILTLGTGNESLFQSLRPELERAALGSNQGKGPEVQAAAVDSLALAAFVLAGEEEGTQGVMRRLRMLWKL